MIKRPSFFFNRNGDCGCAGGVVESLQVARAVCPPTGARVTDDRYFSLVTTPQGRLLVVPRGSNSQCFLTSDFAGFVLFANGEARVAKEIIMTLTLLNPAVSGSYPVPGGFKYLMAATGDPAEWRLLAAPTAGRWLVECVNGSWVFVDAGSIPGIQDVGQSGLTALSGGLMMLVNAGTDEAPNWAIRRLAVADKRVVVGFVDPDTGAQTYRALAAGLFLEHPKAKFPILQCRTFEMLDADGIVISGGLEQALAIGVGSITDAINPVYSPTAKRFFKAPLQTFEQYKIDANVAATETVSYALMPSSHGQAASLNFNYPIVRIDFQIRLTAAAGVTFGLFRDGAFLQEVNTESALDVSLVFMDKTNPLGAHTYDIRMKASGAVANIQYSCLTISTLVP